MILFWKFVVPSQLKCFSSIWGSSLVQPLARRANDPDAPSLHNTEGLHNAKEKPKWNTGREKKLKFSYQEQKDYDTIEADMIKLEDEIAKLDQQMLSFSHDFVKLREIAEKKEKAEALLEEKMDRWMYLEDLAEQIKKQS